MPDDPRLGMFLKQWEQDVAEGKTVRALHERLSDHIEDDEQRQEKLQTEIQALRENSAFNAGRSGGDFGAGGTGRFATIPQAVPTPPPFQPQPLVAVNVEPPARSKRHTSIPPAVSKFLSSTAAKVLFLVLAAAGGWLIRHVQALPEAAKVERVP